MKRFQSSFLLIFTLSSSAFPSHAQQTTVDVSGYTRQDGTVVAPYTRSCPGGICNSDGSGGTSASGSNTGSGGSSASGSYTDARWHGEGTYGVGTWNGVGTYSTSSYESKPASNYNAKGFPTSPVECQLTVSQINQISSKRRASSQKNGCFMDIAY